MNTINGSEGEGGGLMRPSPMPMPGSDALVPIGVFFNQTGAPCKSAGSGRTRRFVRRLPICKKAEQSSAGK